MPDLAGDLARAIQALQDIVRDPTEAHEIAKAALAELVRRRMGLAVIPEGRVAVRIPRFPEHGCGWAKWVIGVNPSERGGFMFDGPFLPIGQVSPVIPGGVVIVAEGRGDAYGKRTINKLTAWIVAEDGRLDNGVWTQDRHDWKTLAVRIDDYLRSARDAPLLVRTL